MNGELTTTGIPRWVEAPAALLGLFLASPLLLFTGVLVAATSRGPVFFRQKRVGLLGNQFTMFKFRTMREHDSGPQVTARDDDRITSVGRLLRKTKLDELPELWNVFKGDMSLVGPRPEVPRYVEFSNPLWLEVLRARPGITDPVTLELRNEEELLARVFEDRESFYSEKLLPYKLQGYRSYSQNRSFRTDIGVLWRTAIAVIAPNTSPPPTIAEITHASTDKAVI
jgi:lipopolysaccharide/colanic/teichoic acid biosynthesis glycosyltransferase